MEDPPQPQDMIINTHSSQVQLHIVKSSNRDDIPVITKASLQSTVAPPFILGKTQAAPPFNQKLPFNQQAALQSINRDDIPAITQASLQSTVAPPSFILGKTQAAPPFNQKLPFNQQAALQSINRDDIPGIDNDTDDGCGDDDGDTVSIRIPEKSWWPIERVPSYLHGDKWNQLVSDAEKDERVYEPMVLSLGLYHHGKHQFQKTEEFKDRVLEKFISKSTHEDATKDRDYFYGAIMEKINQIRNNYEGVRYYYTDKEFSTIILRDACLQVNFVEDYNEFTLEMIIPHLGWSMATLMDRDLNLLENQIPFWVIKHMLYLRYGKDEGDKLLCNHLSSACFLNDIQLKTLPWESEEDEPRHLLDAYRTTLLKQEATNHDETTTETKPRFLTKVFNLFEKIWNTSSNNRSSQSLMNLINCPYRSVTYLQAKGISFGPSSHSLTDVRFTSYPCYGKLKLPILLVHCNTKVYFSNMVTFEMISGGSDPAITCYVNFLKSLIETPKDVKVLLEKGILYSYLGNDEEIVKAFKEINTFGCKDFGVFLNVKRKIDEHCNSKTKTWMSELFHGYFRSPWTIIGLFAAAFILCLTFLQTFFTIHPAD